MPAIRPCKAISRTADRPISTPPNSDWKGVKSVIGNISRVWKIQLPRIAPFIALMLFLIMSI